MKTSIKVLIFFVTFLFSATVYSGYHHGGQTPPSPGDLNEDEVVGLVLVREEEKLARDVYITLGALEEDEEIFQTIAESEQLHMDAIGSLLVIYGVEDPIVDDTVGSFTSSYLAYLYDALVSQGGGGTEAALTVGATIEEMGIYEYMGLILNTDETLLINTYSNLNEASENHLRAFVGRLDALGLSYTPNILDQETYDEIIAAHQGRRYKGNR